MHKKQIKIQCPGYQIAADWHHNPESQGIALVLLGLQSTKERNAEFIDTIAAQANMSALVIDFSGHGESPFEFAKTRPAQHLLEAIIAFDWLHTENPMANITVMGTSYGGYIAAYLSRFRDFKKLVLRTPAIYTPVDLYSLHADINAKQTAEIYRKDTAAVANHPIFLQAPKFTGKTLVVVHGKDEWIPKETTDVYREKFSAQLFEAADFRHGLRDPANPQDKIAEYQQHISSWLQQNT